MEHYIASVITLLVSVIIFAFGYGKMSTKVEHNSEKIDECVANCSNYRRDCHQNSINVDSNLIKKLEEIKETMNTQFLKLSVQVAKLEVDRSRGE